jgi:prepilin-type N-terminal cleavage/methylation domain-containing protein
MMPATHHNSDRRGGFTLLELLMVVSIIAVLMSLVIVVMNGVVEQAEEEATKTTVLKVNRLLEQRIEAFDRAFKGSRRDQYVRGTIGLLATNASGKFNYFNDHPDEAPPAITILARKAGFRYEFPQRYVERTAFDGVPSGGSLSAAVTDATNGIPVTVYRKLAFPAARQQLVNEGTANPTLAEIETRVSANWQKHLDYEANALASDAFHSTESAELLYFTLIHSGTFGSSPVDADQFQETEVADIDEDGLPEFVDAWGNPLRFYRWPTRLIDPTAPNPFNPVFSNPADATELDTTPDNDESDGLREILESERLHASLLMKGLPPQPVPIAGVTQRDMLLVDPDDPVGLLYSFLEDQSLKNQGVNVAGEFNEVNYHTPDTYHAPLIVSAGADEVLGLREPGEFNGPAGIYGNLAQYAGTTTAAPSPSSDVVEALYDNVTNRNRRAGGRR